MPKHRRTQREAHGEKKQRMNIMLTPTAANVLDAHAETMGISRSELIERLARGLIDNPYFSHTQR
ncbi:MAG: ribbon-helix-helix protein, CopG family [Coleofasciculus sp. S288]|nr:ribbon-helix-helix protein, CopG family [Coleofasciculus sp. S288]